MGFSWDSTWDSILQENQKNEGFFSGIPRKQGVGFQIRKRQ